MSQADVNPTCAVHAERLQKVEIDTAVIKKDVKHLKEWEAKQNGSLQRLEGKLDKLIFYGMTFALSSLVTLVVALLIAKG